jgi:hypothetical protein
MNEERRKQIKAVESQLMYMSNNNNSNKRKLKITYI